MTETPMERTPTPVDQIAERWVETLVELNPDVAVSLGTPSPRLGEYGDLSPDGHERWAEAARNALRELETAEPLDDTDRVTRTDLASELRLGLELHEAGEHLRDLNVIASPAQEVREVLDLMPTATTQDWATIAERLRNLPRALADYEQSLRTGAGRGLTPARRQIVEVAAQASELAAAGGFFDEFIGGAAPTDGLPESLAGDLRRGAADSAAAYGRLADFLRAELLPRGQEADGVGRERYSLHSRRFLGASVDLDETYQWGLDELQRMAQEQTETAHRILPGASVAEAIAHLESDPSRKLHGTRALREWMQATSDRAVEELAREHFDIPEPVRRLECMIAPTRSGGIYYTSPSDDFSRPGRMWWSVPEGVETFDTWRELTTVYHEGVPGHHLQIGQAVFNRSRLNTWRRQLAGTSGHAEGWALYAERLMADLGYLDDPADRLGMLDGQRMRAARVVLDIGVHLAKPRPDGDGSWDAEYALAFMRANANMDDAFIRFEVNRYLGWPGQAPSYKIGQRIWEELREAARAREGAAFDLRAWHRAALDLGGVGLDTLRSALR
ncbi:MAG TPA: DUF885 domain-containing protein [Microbacteriaceae bacterium]|nr:DUF885 domain-containing protein [Microbacteriaceae bacterium]